MAEPIRVILADDHSVVRAGFRHMLELTGSVSVVAEANDGEECLRLYDEFQPDIVVMDIAMPVLDGFQALVRLLARWPEARVLMLSFHEEPVFAERALEEGAYGYLRKGAAPGLLSEAIQAIYQGRKFVDPELAQELVVRRSGGDDSAMGLLTGREYSVFIGFAEGRSASDIADELGISQNTVNTHYLRIKKKLGVSSRTEMTRLAIRQGLLQP